MREVRMIGLDMAKEAFQVHGTDAAGAVVFRKRLRRTMQCRPQSCTADILIPGQTLALLIDIRDSSRAPNLGSLGCVRGHSNADPLYVADRSSTKYTLLSCEENGEPLCIMAQVPTFGE